MLCKKTIIIGSFILFSVFCSALSSSSSFATANDLSVTYNNGDTVASYTSLFPSCSGDCSPYQYKYLIVDSNIGSSNNFFAVAYTITGGASYNSRIYYNYGTIIYAKPDTYFIDIKPIGNVTFNTTVTFTLTNSLSADCPVCEECQTCPAIPENPYDDKLDKIIVAIYTASATMLVIYFFYCIYRMIIKNSGVK